MSKQQQETIKLLRAEIKTLKKSSRKPRAFSQSALYRGVPRGEKTLEQLFELVNSAVKRGVITQDNWWDALTYLDFKYNKSKFTIPGSTTFKSQEV